MNTKHNSRRYFIFLIVILTLVYVVDEIASNINSSIQPYAIINLFQIPNGDFLSTEYTSAVGFITTFSVLSYALMLIAPFYKALADKYGRKIFLVLNTAIMGVGMGVMLLAPNVWIYILGTLLITFVMSNDMQVMYIIETVPAEHRAKVCNFTKAIGLMGVSIIGALKGAFYNSSVPTSWRMVLVIPALMGIAIALLALIFIHETPTNMRASVMGVMSLILSFGMMLAMIVFVVGLQFAESADIGLVSLIICLPFMIVSCFLLSKLKETKGTDLDSL